MLDIHFKAASEVTWRQKGKIAETVREKQRILVHTLYREQVGTDVTSFSVQGYMMKKGHKRKNWTERWFLLKPSSMSYYVGEDLAEHKGDIFLDGNCTVEARACNFYLLCIVGPTYKITRRSPRQRKLCEVSDNEIKTVPGLKMLIPVLSRVVEVKLPSSLCFCYSLFKIKRERNASSLSSHHRKALKSVCQIRRRSRSGSRVSFKGVSIFNSPTLKRFYSYEPDNRGLGMWQSGLAAV